MARRPERLDRCMESAYAGYLRRGDALGRRAAARTAVTIAREYTSAFGNQAATNGWLQRAKDALREEGPCVESGWIALANAERTPVPREAKRQAEVALDAAQSFGDTQLEIHAGSEAI